MRIDRIVLNNFGSYEGTTTFNTAVHDGKNIILIGGKNGAGKTTLFTAVRVCLYGFMSMGYKNANAYYSRAITKLINNSAKTKRPTTAYVSISISMSNGHELDYYELTRMWTLSDSLTETFSVKKNSIDLMDEEVANFEKYLLTMIPPELFNLYFFDGEKIADFFFSEGSNTRIKDAFLTLCGYDTFEIMRKNFKRTSSNNVSKDNQPLQEYLEAKDSLENEKAHCSIAEEHLRECIDAIQICDADIAALERDYAKKGGITQDEWNAKLFSLKEEEKKRETWNALLKKWANERVPFLMVADQVQAIKEQLEKENDCQKYRYFCEIIDNPEIRELIGNVPRVKAAVKEKYGKGTISILDLSFEQSADLLAQINTILAFDQDKIQKCKRSIRRSIAFSAKLRAELDSSDVTSVQEYMKKRAELFEKKSSLLDLRLSYEQMLLEAKERKEQADSELNKAKERLEEAIKKESIRNISAKAIVMLDKLQNSLYHKQIRKMEDSFRHEISALMRKTKFIDDIFIDDDFNIHIYRNELVSCDTIMSTLKTNTEDQVVALWGKRASDIINAQSSFLSKVKLSEKAEKCIMLPIEIDKGSLSNGEKQIFIMAVYHSLVQLGAHEIPFIIDTPFARIDTEHRFNISKYFFSTLKGQVFILSTNEEINTEHIQILGDKILETYLLENTDNKRTHVVQDSYFEV